MFTLLVYPPPELRGMSSWNSGQVCIPCTVDEAYLPKLVEKLSEKPHKLANLLAISGDSSLRRPVGAVVGLEDLAVGHGGAFEGVG